MQVLFLNFFIFLKFFVAILFRYAARKPIVSGIFRDISVFQRNHTLITGVQTADFLYDIQMKLRHVFITVGMRHHHVKNQVNLLLSIHNAEIMQRQPFINLFSSAVTCSFSSVTRSSLTATGSI